MRPLQVCSICLLVSLLLRGTAAGDEQISYTPGKGVRLPPLDIFFRPAATFLLQGAPDPNKNNVKKFGTSEVFYLDLKKEFGDWGTAFLRIQPGKGSTINSSLDLFTNVNYNEHDNGFRMEAHQYWYRQGLFGEQYSLTAGRIETRNYLDYSIYAGDDDKQFLNYMFNRSCAIEWPSRYGAGIAADISPDWIRPLSFGINGFNAPGKWDELGGKNLYSFEMRTKSPVVFGPGQDNANYRIYGWVNARDHRMLLKPDEDDKLNYGAGFGFDQPVGEIFGAFGRFGWQRPDVAPHDAGPTIEFTWSGGLQIAGKPWGRVNDTAALAVGQAFTSKEYQSAGNPSGAEGHCELYYSLYLNRHIYISPDFQVIWNPNGVTNPDQGDDGVIFVYGLRFRLET